MGQKIRQGLGRAETQKRGDFKKKKSESQKQGDFPRQDEGEACGWCGVPGDEVQFSCGMKLGTRGKQRKAESQ